jgi:hypothetical protein
MKKIIRAIAVVLMLFSVTDFVLAEFFDVYITGIFYRAGFKLIYWTPFATGAVGIILYFINLYFFKPKDVNITEESKVLSVTHNESFFTYHDGKLYITPEKIRFDGLEDINIFYDDIMEVKKDKVWFIFPAILIKTKDKEYLFSGFFNSRNIVELIKNFKEKYSSGKKNGGTRLVQTIVLILAMLFVSGCGKQDTDILKENVWQGNIYRVKDDKNLSPVTFKINNDTLLIYANAIFGKENDTLLITELTDSSMKMKSSNGQLFYVKYQLQKNKENKSANNYNLFVFGNDFYMVTAPSPYKLSEPGLLDYYCKCTVPRKAYLYLDGTYEGYVDWESSYMDYFSAEMMGEIRYKLIFLDNHKVKTIMKTVFQPDVTVRNYYIKGDSLIVTYKNKRMGFKIKDYGYTLEMQTDEWDLTLRKK